MKKQKTKFQKAWSFLFSTFTGTLMLSTSAIIGTNAMPNPHNEKESVLYQLSEKTLQKIIIQQPHISTNKLRIKLLTRKLNQL